MPIFPRPIQKQTFIDAYNQIKRKNEKIPKILRSQNTGWPLMQLGAFYPENDKYIPAAGGGKCHAIPFPYYSFALLLQELGNIIIEQHIPKEYINQVSGGAGVDFEWKAKNPPIEIKCESSGYGALAHITMGGPSKILDGILCSLDMNLGVSLSSGWKDRPLSAEEISQRLKHPEYSIFYEGQIYIDLGALFASPLDPNMGKVTEEDKQKFKEDIQLLKNIFKVDEYLQEQKSIVDFIESPGSLDLAHLDNDSQKKIEQIDSLYHSLNSDQKQNYKKKVGEDYINNLETQLFYVTALTKQKGNLCEVQRATEKISSFSLTQNADDYLHSVNFVLTALYPLEIQDNNRKILNNIINQLQHKEGEIKHGNFFNHADQEKADSLKELIRNLEKVNIYQQEKDFKTNLKEIIEEYKEKNKELLHKTRNRFFTNFRGLGSTTRLLDHIENQLTYSSSRKNSL